MHTNKHTFFHTAPSFINDSAYLVSVAYPPYDFILLCHMRIYNFYLRQLPTPHPRQKAIFFSKKKVIKKFTKKLSYFFGVRDDIQTAKRTREKKICRRKPVENCAHCMSWNKRLLRKCNKSQKIFLLLTSRQNGQS